MCQELIELIVPDYILEHFDYQGLEQISGVIRIELVEKQDPNHLPKSILNKGQVLQDGFMNTLELQTFPTQGKEVYLLLKRRRWKIKGSSKSYYNTYDFHQEGMKATREFGAFLKEIGRG